MPLIPGPLVDCFLGKPIKQLTALSFLLQNAHAYLQREVKVEVKVEAQVDNLNLSLGLPM